MEQSRTMLAIPYGTRDFLPLEAAEKRMIENRLAGIFAGWGYDEVVTPTIEYLDTLTRGAGKDLEPHLYKMVGNDNLTQALRHEMTTPIARLVSSRLREKPLPLRLSYISSVFRSEQVQTGRQCEFYQAGVELMGSSGAAADAEILALAIKGMLAAGLQDFKVCLGQVEFVSGIMEQYQLSERVSAELKAAMEKHDLVLLDNLVEGLSLSENSKKILKELPLLNGGQEMLARAMDMALNAASRRALDNLTEIYELLTDYGVADYVKFDLGIIRDFSYYTGMVFEAYAPGLGFPVCGGGRYDHLLADFGMACPATGFAMGIERILLALMCQGLAAPEIVKEAYVGYAPGKVREAIRKAMEMREAGQVVELASVSGTEDEARACAERQGCRRLIYLA